MTLENRSFTDRCKFSNPGYGVCNWDYDQKRNREIYDCIFSQDMDNNVVLSGGAVTAGTGLSVDLEAGSVIVSGVEVSFTGGNIALTGAVADPEQYNFIYVNDSQVVTVSTDQPTGQFCLLAVVDCGTDAVARVADLRKYKTEDFGYADNLLINPDLSGGSNTINQRAFNGDWGSISNYVFGYDRWYKNPLGGITQNIKEGNYKPNTAYYLFGDIETPITKMSPSSGLFQIVLDEIPTGTLYLIEGSKERPVRTRSTELELWLCQAYCVALTSVYRQIGNGVFWTTTEVRFIVPIPNKMVQNPHTVEYNSSTGVKFRISYTSSTVDITTNPTSVIAKEAVLYITLPVPAGSYKECVYVDMGNNSRIIFSAEI